MVGYEATICSYEQSAHILFCFKGVISNGESSQRASVNVQSFICCYLYIYILGKTFEQSHYIGKVVNGLILN